jgi:hypothetical protein
VKAIGKRFYNQLISEAEYVGEDYDVFGRWLGSSIE